MIIVDRQTLETCDAEDLRNQYRHIMFDFSDPEIVAEVLDGIGKAILSMPDQPVFDSRYKVATVGSVVENEGVYSSTWDVGYTVLTAEQRRGLIAEYRYEIETGGIDVSGQPIPTDRHTQQVLTAMYMRALADSDYSIRFKTSAGFVNLSAEQIIVISEAVHDHVQVAFAREDELLTAIANGDPVTPDDW